MNIDDQIRAVWDEMGLNEEERINELRPLNEKIGKIKKEKIEETIREMQQLQIGIDETKQKHIRMLQVTGASPFEIEEVQKNGIHGSLKERFDQVQDAYEEYKPRYVETVQKFQKMVDTLQEMFEILEVPEQDRGDFAAVGDTDLTAKRLQSFSNKIDRLQNEINANEKYAQQFIQEIDKLSYDLGVEIKNEIRMIIAHPPYRPSDLVKLKNERDLLQEEFNLNSSYIATLGLEIQRLWDILNISEEERRNFLQMHKGVSYNEIAVCVELINSLNHQRNQMVPQLIEDVKKKISEFCKKMCYTQKQEEAIFNRVETELNEKYSMEESNLSNQEELADNEESNPDIPEEEIRNNEKESKESEIPQNENISQEKVNDSEQKASEVSNMEPDDHKQPENEEKPENADDAIPKLDQQNQNSEPQSNENSEFHHESDQLRHEINSANTINELQTKATEDSKPHEEEEEHKEVQMILPQHLPLEEEDFYEEEDIDDQNDKKQCRMTPRKTFVDADDLLTSENSAMNTPQKPKRPEQLKPIENTTAEDREIAYFELLDAEFMHLQHLYEISRPIQELIQQRESIINEYKQVSEENIAAEKPKPIRMSLNPRQSLDTDQPKLEKVAAEKTKNDKTRKSLQPKSARPQTDIEEKDNAVPSRRSLALKTARKSIGKHIPGTVSPEKARMRPPDPSKALRAEKVERRFKVVLPRIERKLAMALFEYKKESGEDFTLNGDVYSKKLPNVQLSQTEKRMAKSSLSGKPLKN